VFDAEMGECVRRCKGRTGHPTIHRGNARGVVHQMFGSLVVPVMDDETYRNLKVVSCSREADGVALEYLSDLF